MRLKVAMKLLSIFEIEAHSLQPSDFDQTLGNSLATAQPQIGLFLSKQLIFAKLCKNQL